ncbi:MAG: HNH endonuclease [Actinomycetota bacterium]|nr:HNH endonuclease [Actinomycetota bacterium]
MLGSDVAAAAEVGIDGDGGGGGDLLQALVAVVDAIVAVDAATLPAGEEARWVQVLDTQTNRLSAAKLAAVATMARRGTHRRLGQRSLQGWLQSNLRMTATQAKKDTDTATALDAGLSSTRDALADGDISVDHATAITQAAKTLPDAHDAERLLLAEADRGDAGRVRQLGRRLQAAADADAAARRDGRRAYEQRTFTLTPDGHGSVFTQGRLHQLAGERLAEALHALAAPHDTDDARSYGQRMADALETLADMALRGGRLPVNGGVTPQITAVVPLATLEARAGRAADPATLSWSGPCRPQALEQLCCEADMAWLVTDCDHRPLWLGRTRRYASPDQRDAARVRDGGCRWPGCSMPLSWCVLHHVDWWEPDGRTDIHRLIPLCAAHHAMHHHGGWDIALDDHATVTTTSPDRATALRETATQARARHTGRTDLAHITGRDDLADITGRTDLADLTGRTDRAEVVQPGDNGRSSSGGGGSGGTPRRHTPRRSRRGSDDPAPDTRARRTVSSETRGVYRVGIEPRAGSRRAARDRAGAHARGHAVSCGERGGARPNRRR